MNATSNVRKLVRVKVSYESKGNVRTRYVLLQVDTDAGAILLRDMAAAEYRRQYGPATRIVAIYLPGEF